MDMQLVKLSQSSRYNQPDINDKIKIKTLIKPWNEKYLISLASYLTLGSFTGINTQ